METPVKQNIDQNPKQNLELWKWFTDDAAKIKDRMWTIATFFYTLLGALLGFVGKELLSDTMSIDNPVFVVLIGVIGCVLSGYGMYMIRSYGYHIRSGWNRADYIRHHINGLSEIWNFGDSEVIDENGNAIKKKSDNSEIKPNHSLPSEAKRMINLLKLFFLIYFGMILLVFIQETQT